MILIKSHPVSVITDLQRRIEPTVLSDATYNEIEEKLIAQCEVKKSTVGAGVKFLRRKQQHDESIEQCAKVLNNLAAECSYNDCCRDRLIRDAFVCDLRSSAVLTIVLQKCENKIFNQCVEHVKLIEHLSSDAQGMKSDMTTHSYKLTTRNNEKVPANYVCIRCGAKAKHLAKK